MPIVEADLAAAVDADEDLLERAMRMLAAHDARQGLLQLLNRFHMHLLPNVTGIAAFPFGKGGPRSGGKGTWMR